MNWWNPGLFVDRINHKGWSSRLATRGNYKVSVVETVRVGDVAEKHKWNRKVEQLVTDRAAGGSKWKQL